MTRQKEWCGDIIEISLQVGECQSWWLKTVATIVEIVANFCQQLIGPIVGDGCHK